MSREMKDSGVEWIGEIPNDWEMRRIQYILNERNEKNNPVKTKSILSLSSSQGVIPRSQKEGGGNKTKEDLTAYKLAYPNDIVMNSMNVLSGSVALSKFYGCVSPVYYMFYSSNENVDINYYNYIFQTKVFQRSLLGLGNGIMMKESSNGTLNTIRMRIPLEKLNKLYLPVPTILEQQKIANFLDKKVGEIDRLIDNAKRSIEEYKKYKQSVITEAVTKGLDNNVEMKDSGIEWIGNIPKDWKIIKMNRLIVSTQNGLSRRNLNNSIGKIVLKLSNMTIKGTIDYSCVNRIDLSDKEIESYGLQEGDFLFVRVNGSKSLVGKCAIYRDIGEPVAFNDHIIRVKINRFCNKKYFLWYLLSNSGKKEIDTHITTAAGQFTINGNSLRDLNISLPPIKEQEKIINYLDSKCIEIDNLISKKEKLILELESYKKSLIYEYVTGKKEVL